jgi:hypothetical protein
VVEPDYSEFSTTPTGWQERQLADWQTIPPLGTEDENRPTRGSIDVVALVAGAVFMLFAVLGLTGLSLDAGFLIDGGIVWVALVGAGVALLVNELRRARRRAG